MPDFINSDVYDSKQDHPIVLPATTLPRRFELTLGSITTANPVRVRVRHLHLHLIGKSLGTPSLTHASRGWIYVGMYAGLDSALRLSATPIIFTSISAVGSVAVMDVSAPADFSSDDKYTFYLVNNTQNITFKIAVAGALRSYYYTS